VGAVDSKATFVLRHRQLRARERAPDLAGPTSGADEQSELGSSGGSFWIAAGAVRPDRSGLLHAFEPFNSKNGVKDWYAWLASRTRPRDGQLVWGQAQREAEPATMVYRGVSVPCSLLDRLTDVEREAVRLFHVQWDLDGAPANDLLGHYAHWAKEGHLKPFVMAYFDQLEEQLVAQQACMLPSLIRIQELLKEADEQDVAAMLAR
jgi:hypothetical protein